MAPLSKEYVEDSSSSDESESIRTVTKNSSNTKSKTKNKLSVTKEDYDSRKPSALVAQRATKSERSSQTDKAKDVSANRNSKDGHPRNQHSKTDGRVNPADGRSDSEGETSTAAGSPKSGGRDRVSAKRPKQPEQPRSSNKPGSQQHARARPASTSSSVSETSGSESGSEPESASLSGSDVSSDSASDPRSDSSRSANDHNNVHSNSQRTTRPSTNGVKRKSPSATDRNDTKRRVPTCYNPPPGFEQMPFASAPGSHSTWSHLGDKQIWHISAPASLDLTKIKELNINHALGGRAFFTDETGAAWGAVVARTSIDDEFLMLPSNSAPPVDGKSTQKQNNKDNNKLTYECNGPVSRSLMLRELDDPQIQFFAQASSFPAPPPTMTDSIKPVEAETRTGGTNDHQGSRENLEKKKLGPTLETGLRYKKQKREQPELIKRLLGIVGDAW